MWCSFFAVGVFQYYNKVRYIFTNSNSDNWTIQFQKGPLVIGSVAYHRDKIMPFDSKLFDQNQAENGEFAEAVAMKGWHEWSSHKMTTTLIHFDITRNLVTQK